MPYLPIDDQRWNNVAAAAVALILAGVPGPGISAAAAPEAEAPAIATALHCGHLIDTANGKMLGETTIVIDGSKIKQVVSGVQAPAGAKIVDLSTETCMP